MIKQHCQHGNDVTAATKFQRHRRASAVDESTVSEERRRRKTARVLEIGQRQVVAAAAGYCGVVGGRYAAHRSRRLAADELPAVPCLTTARHVRPHRLTTADFA